MIITFILSSFNLAIAQTPDTFEVRGMPRIIHYTKKEFNSDPQFWTMCQDNQGILYFGNNEGILIFDGERWQKVKLPNSSSVRSLRTNENGEVYAGGFNELGIVKRDEFGKYYYESLVELLRPEDRNLENVWQIHEAQGYMVFRTAKKLIAIAGNKAITLPTSGMFWYSVVLNDQYYVLDLEGFKRLNLNSLEFDEVLKKEQYHNEEVVTLLSGFNNKGLLLITKKGKAYAINEEKQEAVFLRQLIPGNSSNLIICAIRSGNGTYYIGTLSTKVIQLDASGKTVSTTETFQNLQDNTVLNLFESKDGYIWVLLNNGIDCIDVSSPMTTLFDNAAIFDVLLVEDAFYLATNQGVFVSRKNSGGMFSRSGFEKIEGLEGQAWSIHYFNETILCSHDRGLFIISGNGARKITNFTGIWKVIPVKGREDDFLICTYDAIHLLHFDKAKGFVVKHKVEGFNESSRDILQGDEPGVFWVCHGYKGVFRLKVNEDLTRVVGLEDFKDKNGLPSPFNVNVFRWNNQIVFTTNQGVYTFDLKANHFQPHAKLTNLFGKDHNVRKLLQHGDKTWFVQGDEAGYFLTDSEKPVLQKGLFLNLKGSFNQGMECIVPLGKEDVLIGAITGLYAFDLSYDPAAKAPSKTLIVSVTAQQPAGEVHGSLRANASQLNFTNKTSSIRFDFAAAGFQDKLNIQYSYKLDDAEENWSAWQEMAYKEFSYLRPGNYVFRVKARSLLGESSGEADYQFAILQAWYQTRWAYAFYSVIGILVIIVCTNMVKRKIEHETEKTRDEEAKKRKVLELELAQIKLKQEKEQITKDKEQLEEDVIHKSKELANYTMLLVKKRELLTEMNEDLKNLKEQVRNDTARQLVRDLIKKININLQSEEHLRIFEANFERVHHEFFSQLKSTFSDLSPRELQLCAFVRLNLTNKEIASILNISVRGIETARYRLRKRLGMSHEQDMAPFLEKLYSSNERSPVDQHEETLHPKTHHS